MSVLTEDLTVAEVDDGDDNVSSVPAGLGEMGDVLIRSAIADASKRLYLFLAALSGTRQIQEQAVPMVAAIGKSSGYILSPEEMAQED